MAGLDAAKDFVEKVIADNKVAIFVDSHCKNCDKTKRALLSILPKDTLAVEEIDKMPNFYEVLHYLGQITHSKTTPRVFLEGKFIGGVKEIVAMKADGTLKSTFEAAGVL